ncbi:hypothetical protein Peur_054753 [Populus x canadensis]
MIRKGKQKLKKPEALIKHDILSRFIELGEDPESYLTDKSLRDVVLDFVIAGRDTTATTLSWAKYTDPEGIRVDDGLPDGTKVKARGLVTYAPYSMVRM